MYVITYKVNICFQVLFSPVRKHWLTVRGVRKCVFVYDSMAGSASQTTQQTVRLLAGKRTRVIYNKTCTQLSHLLMSFLSKKTNRVRLMSGRKRVWSVDCGLLLMIVDCI